MEPAANRLIEIITPVVDYLDTQQSIFEAPPRPRCLEDKTIALLANWKPISLPFLEVMAEQLKRKGQKVFALHPDWQFTHPERVAKIAPEADKLARECELMLSGVAD